MKSLIILIISLVFILPSTYCYGMSVAQLKNMIDNQKPMLLIDIRNNAEYQKSHIPGAINIPAMICSTKKLPPTDLVIIYGDGIDKTMPANALIQLNKNSLGQVELLIGGFLQWERFNYPITKQKGMEREVLPYIIYHQLENIVKNNPNLVFIDLRNKEKLRARTINLSKEFPGVRILDSPFQNNNSRNSKKIDFYVLIDNLDNASENMARKMKAAGLKNFVILAGGAESILRKGQAGLKQR